MEEIIKINHITKEFRVPDRHEGLKGSIKDLFSRSYHTVHAVDDISMNVTQGEIVGYLGPNGAGKSTLLKAVSPLFVLTITKDFPKLSLSLASQSSPNVISAICFD